MPGLVDFIPVRLSKSNLSIDELGSRTYQATTILWENLQQLQTHMNEVLSYAPLGQYSTEIKEIFDTTIGSSIQSYRQYIDYIKKEMQGPKDIFMFHGLFASHIITIFESILEFEKRLNASNPYAIDEIIDLLENSLVGVVSSILPVAGILLSSSEPLSIIREFVEPENLSKTVQRWHQQMDKMKQNEWTREINARAEVVCKIADATGVSAVTVAELGQKNNWLQQVYSAVNNNVAEQAYFKDAVAVWQALPRNTKDVEKILSSLKDGLVKIFKDNDKLALIQQSLIKDLDPHFGKVLDNLCKAVSSSTPFNKKIYLLHEVVENLNGIPKIIAKSINKQLGNNVVVGAVVKKATKNIAKVVQGTIKAIMPVPLLFLHNQSYVISQLFSIKSVADQLLYTDLAPNTSQKFVDRVRSNTRSAAPLAKSSL